MSNTPPTNARFVDMGGGHVAEMIAHQLQLFWDPTSQTARVIFNSAPYIRMGPRWQRIGIEQDMLEQDLSNLLHLRLIPTGTLDPITGADLSQVSLLGVVMIHKGAFDFFYNVRAGTPGYPLQNTILGEMPTYQEENRFDSETIVI